MRPLSTKTKRIFLVCGVLFGMGFLTMLLWTSREPRIEGKPFSHWLNQLNEISGEHQSAEMLQAAEIIRRHKTEFLPQLERMVNAEDSIIKRVLLFIQSRQRWVRFHLMEAEDVRRLAYRGLWTLGLEAASAIPALERSLMLRQQTEAGAVLAHIGPQAFAALDRCLTNGSIRVRSAALGGFHIATNHLQSATPLLARFIRLEGDRGLRVWAAIALGRIGREESLVVPVLVDGLSYPENDTRAGSARALANYPEQARLHLAELQKLADNTNDRVGRLGGIDALKIIAPELVPRD